MPGKSQILAGIPLFSGLSEAEVQALAQRAVEKRFAPGEMLFWEGEPCAGIFLIGRGSVRIFKTSSGGRDMVLAMESAPSTVAELPLFDGGPYPASVRAADDVTAYFINKTDFHHVCRQYPDVALKVLAVVGRRLRHLVGVVESITFGSVTQRLARMVAGSPGITLVAESGLRTADAVAQVLASLVQMAAAIVLARREGFFGGADAGLVRLLAVLAVAAACGMAVTSRIPFYAAIVFLAAAPLAARFIIARLEIFEPGEKDQILDLVTVKAGRRVAAWMLSAGDRR